MIVTCLLTNHRFIGELAIMKIVTVVGARPQFVKAAAVSRILRASVGTREILLHTGQHYDDQMSAVFFRELDIPQPDHNLGIGTGSHGGMTGRMLEAIERTLLVERPDAVLVYGDTNSTLAGALAAVKLHIPVAHIEAGLRSFNRKMPEEINRVLTDHISAILFAPTETAAANLLAEGLLRDKSFQVGDVMYNAVLYYSQRAREQSRILELLELDDQAYILATIHRAENTDDCSKLEAIVAGLAGVAKSTPVVLPLHPRTRAAASRSEKLARDLAQLRVIEPVGYLDMVRLEMGAAVIATDSGGVQKEAFFQGVPCVTLRDETEWVELVHAGWNRLCPPVSAEAISAEPNRARTMRGSAIAPYGNGRACVKIVDRLKIGRWG